MDDQLLLSEILRYQNGNINYRTDIIIRENSLTLKINGLEIATLACLDDKLEELGVGFLNTEGVINGLQDLKEFKLCNKRTRLDVRITRSEEELREYMQNSERTTGCGGGVSGVMIEKEMRQFSDLSIDPDRIPDLMLKFQNQSVLFRQTGGVHSAALIKDTDIFSFAEDIGRHNAVDKVIGTALLEGRKASDFYLLTSGRISSEIVRKAIRLQIPLIISQAAPTSRAVSLAWQYGIYLIGFARGTRFNIYTGLHKISRISGRS